MNSDGILLEGQKENGFYLSIVVNTKGQKVPPYFMSYLQALNHSTEKVFEVAAVHDITYSIPNWKKHQPKLRDSDTLAQVYCRITTDISEPLFREYCDVVFSQNILPFCVGCGFSIVAKVYQYLTPKEFTDLVFWPGPHSLTLKGKELSQQMGFILRSMFALEEDEINLLKTHMDILGECHLENVLSPEQVSDFTDLMYRIDENFIIE